MKIGIFGGTFNPPHNGHVISAAETKRRLGLDALYIIPTAMPPHKQLPKSSPTPDMRLEMIRIAMGDMEDTVISAIEIDRGGKSFTSETLEHFKDSFKEAELWLILGSDMLLTIDSWYRSKWILDNVSIAAFARDDNSEALQAKSAELKSTYGVSVEFIQTNPIDISSTELRKMLKDRLGRQFLSDSVYHYIIKNRLYDSKPDFDWLREMSLHCHDEKRTPHVLGTESEAVSLADRWGADRDEARTAAILHDITKNLHIDEQLILCKKYDIVADIVEKASDKLLHAKTGALVAYWEFGVSDAVRDAIFWHTTGRADMSLLEKIIYLADYIEPTREFNALEKLRGLAYSDIDKAMELGLKMSLEDMANRGIAPHPRTREALEFLVSKEG